MPGVGSVCPTYNIMRRDLKLPVGFDRGVRGNFKKRQEIRGKIISERVLTENLR